MSHTSEAFKKGKAMIAFLTAGVPSMEDTVKYVLDLEKAGVDLIEIGVPFSDPIADGPVIMEADVKALENHIHLPQVMELVKTLRTKTQIPIVLLTYYNPVFNYPSARFFEEAKEIGIDGVIIPDLPMKNRRKSDRSRMRMASISSRWSLRLRKSVSVRACGMRPALYMSFPPWASPACAAISRLTCVRSSASRVKRRIPRWLSASASTLRSRPEGWPSWLTVSSPAVVSWISSIRMAAKPPRCSPHISAD